MANRTCLITGGSRGIGLATGLRMARAGYDVVVSSRGEAELKQAAEQIAAVGVRAEAISADVSQPTDAERLIKDTQKRLGRLDVLVNNAGTAPLMSIEEMDTEAFERVFTLNNAAIFHLTKAAWPLMKAQGGGTIVNISSMASLDPFPKFAVYGASKAWVNVFTRAVASEGKPLGIRVYSVAPGAVETKMLRSVFPDLPAENTLDPDDVAAVIESVCDARMAHCTGETVFVKK